MRAFALSVTPPITSAAEGLNGENIAFLHLGSVVGLDSGNTFGAMDAVW